MFVGHEFLAFALAGSLTRLLGRDARTALVAGGVAAVCALLPDLDVAYGVATYVLAVSEGTALSWDAFWGVTNGVHRVVTHTLPVGVAATLCVAAVVGVVRRRDRSREPTVATDAATAVFAVLALAASAAVVTEMGRVVGESASVVAATYLLTVCVAAAVLARRVDASVGVLTLAAGVGFLSHPFGDVFMASPPPLLSPFAPSPLTDRVVFADDGTVNLLAVLFVEVATVWAGLLTYLRLSGRRLGDAFAGRAVLGVGYAPAVFVLPRPTMVDAHVLGFTAVPLAVGVGVTAYGWRDGAEPAFDARRERVLRGVVTGLATLTVAAGAYLLAYLVV
ncbi:metal-dependent hydrolase [Halogeometricum limi]|uniref:LexA-binding, inner membrane-associated putative hydrolase n=1 Tax=Halogeometricum limi TaxID=555875 RepID=A0A1I6HA35_9EURY|nr:metal-dependent hydrolase [Halogeometricum limi]SFR51312.1 LexA-binding, inner membrane-associated putative hydrolase [Halogeometricum limi]